MARARDLWHAEVKDPDDPSGKRRIKVKTKRHPDRGGSKNAKRWLAVWFGPEGTEESKAFRTQDAALKYARKQEDDLERGEYLDRKAGREMLAPLLAKWIRLRDVGAGSRDRYERASRLHVEPVFGARQVRGIQPSEVLEWMRNLAKTRGYSTQQLAFTILQGALDIAVADGLRRDNPCRSSIVPRPRQDEEEREAWTVGRVWGVIDGHPGEYRVLPTLQAGCGLRENEAFALALDDFDFEAGKVTIGRQVSRVAGRWYFKLPKGGKARTVPLPAGVARAVQAYAEQYEPRPYTLPWMNEAGDVEGEHACNLLVRWHGEDPRTCDQHVRPSSYDRGVWKPALVAAKVIPEPVRGPRGGVVAYAQDPEDGTHALRHFYSTTLLDAGVSLAGVMSFMGHSKRAAPVTLRVYSHVTEETFRAAGEAIDRSLFRLRPVQDHRASGTETEQVV